MGVKMGAIASSVLGDFQYVSKITDVLGRWTTLYLIKSKSDTLGNFKLFVHSVIMPMGRRVHRLRADKGGEYIGKECRDYSTTSRVRSELAATATPREIGILERVGGVVFGMVRCRLAFRGPLTFLGGE